ncbi:MAG: hypothetical protein JWR32_1793 [Mycobacterium sp.]|jgi:hypothetical protein|nr:hypothetical protein [Mycobacterium sp.]
MQSGLKHLIFAAGAAVAAFGATPTAAADPTPAPATPTVTVTVTAPAPGPGPQDNQSCTSSLSSTKCVKNGDAEINAGIPAPYPGVFGIYGPFWAG